MQSWTETNPYKAEQALEKELHPKNVLFLTQLCCWLSSVLETHARLKWCEDNNHMVCNLMMLITLMNMVSPLEIQPGCVQHPAAILSFLTSECTCSYFWAGIFTSDVSLVAPQFTNTHKILFKINLNQNLMQFLTQLKRFCCSTTKMYPGSKITFPEPFNKTADSRVQ
jgi:hypothetical protein